MQIKATVNGMPVEKNVNNLDDFVDYVRNTLDFEVSDIEQLKRIDV
jgi:aerobic-type carbon monoxide dehydrogenase small subunit (CoxS/CutS family)